MAIVPAICIMRSVADPALKRMEARMKVFAAVLLSLLAANAFGQCNLNPQVDASGSVSPGVPFKISWNSVSGATNYELRRAGFLAGGTNPLVFAESRSNYYHYTTTSTEETIFTTAQGAVNYELRAIGESGVLCTAPFSVNVATDPATRSIFERVVIPVAGSLTGANGSHFKTELTMTVPRSLAPTAYSGRIIFHPAGAPISDGDPSIPYSIVAKGSGESIIHYDDVVAAIGRTGLGTLDIVPDAASHSFVPSVEARVYAPEQEDSFTGTEEAVTVGEDGAFVTRLSLPVMQFIHPDASRYRASIGVRTFGADPVLMEVTIQPVESLPWHKQMILAPNTFQHVALSTLAEYPALVGGETVTIMFRSSTLHPDGMTAVIPYYTLTNNVTNDLSIFPGLRRPNPIDVSNGLIQ
jgi:hypothetical protein